MRVVRDIADSLPPNKHRNAYKIINILLRNQRHIIWDLGGDIIRFNKAGEVITHMKRFLELLLYNRKGSVEQINSLADIVKPFYRNIDNIVENEKLKQDMSRRLGDVRASKFIAW